MFLSPRGGFVGSLFIFLVATVFWLAPMPSDEIEFAGSAAEAGPVKAKKNAPKNAPKKNAKKSNAAANVAAINHLRHEHMRVRLAIQSLQHARRNIGFIRANAGSHRTRAHHETVAAIHDLRALDRHILAQIQKLRHKK